MTKFFHRASRRLLKSALRSVRNTFRYEAPAIGRFIARQLRPPQRATPPKARAPRTRTPAAPPASAARPRSAPPAKARAPRARSNAAAVQRLVAEGMRLRDGMQRTTSLTEYQDLCLQYERVRASLAALSTPKKSTAVKSHTRSGQHVRRYTRGASQ